MAALTIRNLDEETKQALRLRAAKHGVSMEQEVRLILRKEVLSEGSIPGTGSGENWYRSIRKLVEPHGGFELEIPPRSKKMREPPTFE
ncbi:plasmid stabilization protein [Pseudaminobacter sp. 19-2017]|uniref:Plasmid stabilization protein n=1 Tax=Pseudaminobacter soli (ex Zhang et al. 2022) TaxID=2831468 RepID=A0A942E375_9HYPH|nr:plasmid stabilization protein [Pseudaminobacter soli]MBS3650171.1 plasmid stabilization protein [Pseudaminobacter soli]